MRSVPTLAGGPRLSASAAVSGRGPKIRSAASCARSVKHLDVAGAPLPWLAVEDTQRADGMSVVIDQGYAEVGDDSAAADHRMLHEYRVASRVFENQGIAVRHCVLTDGQVEWRLTILRVGHIAHSDAALEVLPVGIDEGQRRERGIQRVGGRAGDSVVNRLGRAVEQTRRPESTLSRSGSSTAPITSGIESVSSTPESERWASSSLSEIVSVRLWSAIICDATARAT